MRRSVKVPIAAGTSKSRGLSLGKTWSETPSPFQASRQRIRGLDLLRLTMTSVIASVTIRRGRRSRQHFETGSVKSVFQLLAVREAMSAAFII